MRRTTIRRRSSSRKNIDVYKELNDSNSLNEQEQLIYKYASLHDIITSKPTEQYKHDSCCPLQDDDNNTIDYAYYLAFQNNGCNRSLCCFTRRNYYSIYFAQRYMYLDLYLRATESIINVCSRFLQSSSPTSTYDYIYQMYINLIDEIKNIVKFYLPEDYVKYYHKKRKPTLFPCTSSLIKYYNPPFINPNKKTKQTLIPKIFDGVRSCYNELTHSYQTYNERRLRQYEAFNAHVYPIEKAYKWYQDNCNNNPNSLSQYAYYNPHTKKIKNIF